ncbi:MAG: alpha/beta fold hydrolase [Steroidobacteraceae bacterium]
MSRATGVYFEVRGQGYPLVLAFPMMASHMPEDPSGQALRGYLDILTDRYRVLVMDYPDQGPDIGRSRRIAPSELTARRVCEDMLAVADAANFQQFIWWGFSWGGVCGLQLASRTNRIAALVCGGWPPLGGQYADMLRATRTVAANPPPDFPELADQYVTFYESVQGWPESERVGGIKCPRMTFAGSKDEVEVGGVIVRVAPTIREHRVELERQGWYVAEIPGRDHSVYLDPEAVVPVVRPFLDRVMRT